MGWDSRIMQNVSHGVPFVWECLSLVWTNILVNPQEVTKLIVSVLFLHMKEEGMKIV